MEKNDRADLKKIIEDLFQSDVINTTQIEKQFRYFFLLITDKFKEIHGRQLLKSPSTPERYNEIAKEVMDVLDGLGIKIKGDGVFIKKKPKKRDWKTLSVWKGAYAHEKQMQLPEADR